MFIIGYLIGTGITLLVTFLVFKIRKPKVETKYLKRGLYSTGFERTNKDTGRKLNYDVVAEIGLLERTKKKLKIEVIELKTSITSTHLDIMQIKKILNGWHDIDDKEIEWFEEHPADVRVDKINGLLED